MVERALTREWRNLFWSWLNHVGDPNRTTTTTKETRRMNSLSLSLSLSLLESQDLLLLLPLDIRVPSSQTFALEGLLFFSTVRSYSSWNRL